MHYPPIDFWEAALYTNASRLSKLPRSIGAPDACIALSCLQRNPLKQGLTDDSGQILEKPARGGLLTPTNLQVTELSEA
jgi:hypothetical protein